jgi:hypothetical protein
MKGHRLAAAAAAAVPTTHVPTTMFPAPVFGVPRTPLERVVRPHRNSARPAVQQKPVCADYRAPQFAWVTTPVPIGLLPHTPIAPVVREQHLSQCRPLPSFQLEKSILEIKSPI